MADITLERLRGWHPEWEWVARRSGFGWEYVGRQHWSEVTVRVYSILCGPSDDDYATQWRVEEGTESWQFASWSVVQMATEEMAKP